MPGNTGIFNSAISGTGTSAIALSNGNLTATLTGTATGSASTTPGSNLKVYLECQLTFSSGIHYIGLVNQLFVPNAFFPGGDFNSVGLRLTDGEILINGNNQANSGVTAVSGNWLGIAVNFQTQTVQFRNITTNSTWSTPFNFNAQIEPSPNFFSVGLTATGNAATINIDGAFLGAPPDGTYTRWDVSATPISPAAFDPAYCGSDPSSKINLTNSNLTATLATGGLKGIAASTPGDNAAVYFEVTPTFTTAFDSTLGLMNINETVGGNFPGRTGFNSFCWHGDAGEVYLNGGGVLTTSTPWASGDVVGIAINFPAGTAQIRNVTHASAWSAAYSFGSAITPPAPMLFCAGLQEVGQTCTVNFNGPFVGTPPPGTWVKWHSAAPPPSGDFPLFTPQLPPPTVGTGGTVPIVIAPAPVPPSTAGLPLIRFTFGSATTPPASAAFPEFTTTFPSPPIVFSNIYTGGSPPVTPPATTSTPPLGGSYNTGGQWGPPIGPALPPVVPPTRPFMAEAEVSGASAGYSATSLALEPNNSDDEPPSRPRRGRRRHV